MSKQKFQVGDKVVFNKKYVHDIDNYGTGTVMKVHPGSKLSSKDEPRTVYEVLFEEDEYCIYSCYSYELLPAQSTFYEFKVGDRAISTKDKTKGDETERSLNITLEEARKMYDEGGKLRELALKLFTEDELNPKPKYPETWSDYCYNFYPYEKHMHYFPNFTHGFCGDDADVLIAFGKLIRLRRAWIGDWKPDWTDISQPKYTIKFGSINKVQVQLAVTIAEPLSFPTKEMAKDFKECFKDLLVQAKGLY